MTWQAERDLLGLCVRDPVALDEHADQVTAEDFDRPRHGALWRRLLEMRADPLHARAEADAWVGAVLIEAFAWGQEVDGASYVSGLTSTAPPSQAAAYYVSKVRAAATARALRHATTTATERLDNGESPEAVASGLEAALTVLASRSTSAAPTWVAIAATAQEVYQERLQASINPEGVGKRIIPSPWPMVNELTRGGFRRREMSILAGRPGTGKTAAAMQIAQHAAMYGAVGVFSMEMTRHGLTTRELAREGRVFLTKLTNVEPLSEIDRRALTHAIEVLDTRPIWIDDTPALHITQLRARAKRLKEIASGFGVDLATIVVDYVQLATASAGKYDNEQVILSKISQAMVALAKELDVAVLALAQMNRAVEGRANERPKNSDLRGTGQLEQDAAVIAFTFRDVDAEDSRARELIVTKARHGETGAVPMTWEGEFQTLHQVSATPAAASRYRPQEVTQEDEDRERWR